MFLHTVYSVPGDVFTHYVYSVPGDVFTLKLIVYLVNFAEVL